MPGNGRISLKGEILLSASPRPAPPILTPIPFDLPAPTASNQSLEFDIVGVIPHATAGRNAPTFSAFDLYSSSSLTIITLRTPDSVSSPGTLTGWDAVFSPSWSCGVSDVDSNLLQRSTWL